MLLGSSNGSGSDRRAHGEAVVACLQEMGQARTNPVLDVLEGAGRVETNRKYPRTYLHPGGPGWRAFYHCHPAPCRSPAEHGHFHLFARVQGQGGKDESWTHVAALSMDAMGQPLRWFAVNGWVTGGRWLSAHQLARLIEAVPVRHEGSAAERWLAAMVGVHRREIEALLNERDRSLAAIAGSRATDEVLGDRAVYELAQCPVRLLEKLNEVLAEPAEAVIGKPGGES
jgi:hypothetical protein